MPLFLAMLVLPPAAQGFDQERRVLDSDALQRAFTDMLLQKAPWPRKDLKITGFFANPSSLSVPEGQVSFQALSPIQANHLGRNVVTAAVLVDGKEEGQLKMSGDLRLIGTICYSTRKISRNSVITEDDITVKRGDITMLGTDLVSEPREAIGMMSKTSLQAGAVLYKNQLDAQPLVERGDMVTIIARSGPLKVTTPGEAREKGAEGEMVRVKNLMSRKEIYARVLDHGTVEVVF